jgi:hypothetical protein
VYIGEYGVPETGTDRIVVAGNRLYRQGRNDDVWRYEGTPCSTVGDADQCNGWKKLDISGKQGVIASDGDELYMLRVTPTYMIAAKTCDDCAW